MTRHATASTFESAKLGVRQAQYLHASLHAELGLAQFRQDRLKTQERARTALIEAPKRRSRVTDRRHLRPEARGKPGNKLFLRDSPIGVGGQVPVVRFEQCSAMAQAFGCHINIIVKITYKYTTLRA